MREFLASFDDLLTQLDDDRVPHQVDKADESVIIPTEKGDLDSALLLRWQTNDGVLQLIQQIPGTVPAAARSEVAEAVVRLNHALAVPGAGFDPDEGVLYFRTYVPIATGPVPATVVQAMFSTTVGTAADLLPVLHAVAAGELEPAGVVDAMNAQIAKRQGG